MSSEKRGSVPPEAAVPPREPPDQSLPEAEAAGAQVETARVQKQPLVRRRELSDAEAYDLTAAEHQMILNYEPRFLAKGGEHIVYEIPESRRDGSGRGVREVVVKVDARVMRELQVQDAQVQLPLDAVTPEGAAAAKDVIAEDRRRFEVFRSYFDREHVPNVKQAFIKVPVTPVFVRQLHGGRPPAGWQEAKESWSVVKVQRAVPEAGRPGTVSVTVGYLEKRYDESERAYDRVTQAYLENRPPDGFSVREFETLHPGLSGLLYFADSDPAAAAALRDFVGKCVAYSNATGDILDLAGDDNVVFFKKGDGWDYQLIDAFYSNNPDMIATSREIMLKALQGDRLEASDRGRLMNVVNYARGVNALADRLGMPDRIDVVPDILKGKLDFFSVITR